MARQPRTLFEYYQARGKALPPITERAQLFEQHGLGRAVEYRGTADQNVALLGRLQAVAPAPIIPPPTPPRPAEAVRRVAPTPVEGDVRINPATGAREILTPAGVWEVVTPEVERLRMGRPLLDVQPLPVVRPVIDPVIPADELRGVVPVVDPEPVVGIPGANETALRINQTALAEQTAFQQMEQRLRDMETRLLAAKPPEPERTRRELTTEILAEWGITPEAFKEIRDLTAKQRPLLDEITALKAQEAEQLAATEGRMASMVWIRGEQRLIQERFERRRADVSAQLGAISMNIEALRGNMAEARTIANDMIEAAVYDEEREYRRYTDWYNRNWEFFQHLTTEQRRLFDNHLELVERRRREAREDKQMVAQLMLENPRAGINPRDSFEVASQKATAFRAALPVETAPGETGIIPIDEARRWEVPYGTTFEQLREMGIRPGEPIPIVADPRIAVAQRQWTEIFSPKREEVRRIYEEELKKGQKQNLKRRGFSVAEIARIIATPFKMGIPAIIGGRLLKGKDVSRIPFDEAEFQRRLRKANVDDASLREHFKGTGIALEELKAGVTPGGEAERRWWQE